MNNMINKMMMTGIACVALCGTTLAAPAHNNRPMPKGKAPMVQVAKPAAKPVQHKAVAKPMPKPAQHHVAKAPVRHEVRPTHPMPPRPVTPCHRHHRHDCHDCHYDHNGWVELGAGILGGILGAIIAG